MMKKVLILAIAAVLSLSIVGCESANDWNVYSKNGIEIQYPDEWNLDTTNTYGTDLILFGPDLGKVDEFYENINVLSQDLPENMGLKEYSSISKSQIEEFMPGSEVIEFEDVDAELPYQHIVYTGPMEGRDLEYMQRYIVKNNRAYVLTFTATQENFDLYKEEVNKIFDTFEIR
ncbi:hypothetical protein K6119_18570 [Paracrocinitomix mangrovi]|uniref:hypothetical protein n=1 Tax=Paracrocinitomix mangrovi TaxID=2862509 RepID=UPI001C8D824A|nr:hypothetical protein [Paracrocinitomix mangrovi]UKN01732.1 hypothetical protein K6119_18570 [Paracrocinitomix mangrovi]